MNTKLTKLIAISCLTIVSMVSSFGQIIGEDDILRDITPVIDIIAIKHIQLQASNDFSDLVDEEMNDIHQIWQQSLDGIVVRVDEPPSAPSIDVDSEESNDVSDDFTANGNIESEGPESTEKDSDILLERYLDDELEYLAYPNPAKDLLNIKFEDDGYFEISLFNVVGKLELYYQSFEENSHILNVSQLPVGMYLLQIFDGTNIKTKRINVVR